MSVWTSGNVCNDGSPTANCCKPGVVDTNSEPPGALTNTCGRAASEPTCNNGDAKTGVSRPSNDDDVPPTSVWAVEDTVPSFTDMQLLHVATLSDGSDTETECFEVVTADDDSTTEVPLLADDTDDVVTWVCRSTMPFGIPTDSGLRCVDFVSLLTLSQSTDTVPQADDAGNACVIPCRSLVEKSPMLSASSSSIAFVALRLNRTLARCFISSSSFKLGTLSGSRDVAWKCDDKLSSRESTANGLETSASARVNASSTSRAKLYSPFLPANNSSLTVVYITQVLWHKIMMTVSVVVVVT